MDVCLDSKLLKHIVFNLLSNAIKYSAENKKIILKIDSTDEQVLLEVIDQGIGIPEEEQKVCSHAFIEQIMHQILKVLVWA